MTSLHPDVSKKKGKKHWPSSSSTCNTIDEASKESFPSSDPPAWTLGSDHYSVEEKRLSLGYLLTQEHLTIRRVVHAMVGLLNALQQGKPVDLSKLKKISDFFIHYVDACHHKKEELIFAAMRQGEERPSDYILNDLLHEHAHGKELHTQLASWIKAKKHDQSALIKIIKGMINLHHNHTNKEEESVFPMINKLIDKEKREAFLRAFIEFEEQLGKNVYADLSEFSAQLK